MICGAFHNPTRERGTGHPRRQSYASRSLAHASGWDANQTCNFKTQASIYDVAAKSARSDSINSELVWQEAKVGMLDTFA